MMLCRVVYLQDEPGEYNQAEGNSAQAEYRLDVSGLTPGKTYTTYRLQEPLTGNSTPGCAPLCLHHGYSHLHALLLLPADSHRVCMCLVFIPAHRVVCCRCQNCTA
jgi:hypothetical protein